MTLHSANITQPTRSNPIVPSSKTVSKKAAENCKYVIFAKGYQAGIVVAWIADATTYKQANINPSKLLEEGYMSQLNDDLYHFIGLINRKGKDGITPMQQITSKSSHPCKQFVFILSQKNNTCSSRKSIATKLMNHINNNVSNGLTSTFQHNIEACFTFPCIFRPVNYGLLDHHVKQLMMYLFCHSKKYDLSTLVNDDKIMKVFWSDIIHGKSVMMQE